MIEMRYTLVAILAVHGVFGDTDFTDPTVLHGLLLLWEGDFRSGSVKELEEPLGFRILGGWRRCFSRLLQVFR
jgi:hypothetical protein